MCHTKSSLFDINLAYNSRKTVQTDGQPAISFLLPPPWCVGSPAPGLLRPSNNSNCDALCLQLWRHSDVILPGCVSQPLSFFSIYKDMLCFPSLKEQKRRVMFVLVYWQFCKCSNWNQGLHTYPWLRITVLGQPRGLESLQTFIRIPTLS